MTEIRIGMSVHLVKTANCDAELKRHGIGIGDIGTVMGASDPLGDDDPLWKVRFTRHGLDKIFWLGRENIEPTSPHGVKIESPAENEPKFFWVKQYDVWWPACLESDGTYSVASNPSGYSEPASAFDEIGPRIEVPEGLK